MHRRESESAVEPLLLGKVYDENGTKVIFVSGAVDAQNLEFDISMIKFGDSEWSGIYAEINKYFDDLSIVGWFLSRMGFSAEINDQMKRLHRDNFPGEGKDPVPYGCTGV